MKITYKMIEDHPATGDSRQRSYGIAAYDVAEATAPATVVCLVHDVTTDKHALSDLVQKCNDLKLSPIHLCDVIEDFMIH